MQPNDDRPLQAVPDDNELLKLVDGLIFEKTGKHLNTLQQLVLQGMYDGKTYETIARDTRYTTKYVREVGYKLLKTLSAVMDEEMQKGNLKAAIDRRNISNTSNFGRDYIHQYVEYVHTLNLKPCPFCLTTPTAIAPLNRNSQLRSNGWKLMLLKSFANCTVKVSNHLKSLSCLVCRMRSSPKYWVNYHS